MKVLIATEKPFAAAAVKGIKEIVTKVGFELALLEKYTEKKQLLDAVKDANAIIIRSDKITEEVINAAPNLKIVVRAGAGYDNVDLAAATAKNVCVMNTPGQNANAVAELIFGMLLYQARNHFNGKPGTELKGKKIGIHAYGNIGRDVARIAKGFGMETYGYHRRDIKETMKADGVKPVATVEELYKTCDIVSTHLPSRPENKGAVNYELLSNLPEKATFVNTARQEVINEDDVLRLMKERPNFAFVSDITPAKLDAFKEFEGRYYVTPKKMGAQTAEANINAGLAAANQIVDFLKNGVEKFRVN